MKRIAILNAIVISLLMLGMPGCSSNKDVLIIDDENGVLGESEAPVVVEVKLDKNQVIAAEEGRLGILDLSAAENEDLIPVQLASSELGENSHLVLMMPDGEPGPRKFKLTENDAPYSLVMMANLDPNSGQVHVEEGGKKVLQYNYQTIYEKDVVRDAGETLEQHVRAERDTFVTASIYAVPRSNYIHPLYGLDGEMLTRDWPVGGHPHHRAIFWAWPEVEVGSEGGDIYALQRIFARPTGKIKLTSGPVFSRIIAENLWMWEDREPIVREFAVINVYRATEKTRVIDLTIKLDALKDSITIATRNTDSYGGLNMRMQTPEEQKIAYFSDVDDSNPLRSWSDFNGIFKGNESASGLMVLQHRDNPEYPGSWVEYPNLAWVQPTFPTNGTRYPLDRSQSLILRYRLVVHAGGEPDRITSEKRWDAFHHANTPLHVF
jgi:hypothetical protein